MSTHDDQPITDRDDDEHAPEHLQLMMEGLLAKMMREGKWAPGDGDD